MIKSINRCKRASKNTHNSTSIFACIKDTIYLSLPMAASRFSQMLSNFIGMIMLAHLGKKVLAASALINATFSVIFLFFISILFAISFITSQYLGSKKIKAIGRLFQQGLLLAIVLGFLMALVFYFTDYILHFFQQAPDLIAYTKDYFHALTWGAIPMMISVAMQQFCYGILKQRAILFVNILVMISGVLLSYLLIFGLWGMPKLGVSGLAYAVSIQSLLSIVFISLYLYFSGVGRKLFLFKKHHHQNLNDFFKIIKIGWPMSLQFGGELLSIFVIAMMIGWLGASALAAVQVTQQWMLLIVVPVFAMSEAGGILVGHAIGKKEYHSLIHLGRANIYVGVFFVTLIGMVFYSFPDFFASFYFNVKDPKNIYMLHTVRILFLLLVFTLILNSARDIISGLLRGLFDTRFPMQVGLFVMWGMVVPIGYCFAFYWHFGVIGFRLGGLIGLFCGLVIIQWRWKHQLSRLKNESTSNNPANSQIGK